MVRRGLDPGVLASERKGKGVMSLGLFRHKLETRKFGGGKGTDSWAAIRFATVLAIVSE